MPPAKERFCPHDLTGGEAQAGGWGYPQEELLPLRARRKAAFQSGSCPTARRFISGVKNCHWLLPFSLACNIAVSACFKRISLSSPSSGNTLIPMLQVAERRVPPVANSIAISFMIRLAAKAASVAVFHPAHNCYKLVASQPGHGIVFSCTPLKPLRHLFQDQVSSRMAKRVVDKLELIQIDEEDRYLFCAPFGA